MNARETWPAGCSTGDVPPTGYPATADAGRTVSFSFDLPTVKVLTANHRYHYRDQADRSAWLRGIASQQWQAKRRTVMGMARAQVTYLVTYGPPARKRDAANWMPTVKALVDGLVSGPAGWPASRPWHGILPDDDDRHLVGPDPRAAIELLAAPNTVRIRLQFTELPPLPPPDDWPGKPGPASRLTAVQKRRICEERTAGARLDDIADRHGISRSMVQKITRPTVRSTS